MKKTPKKIEILKRLGEILNEAHISQAGIARQMGTSPALISRWKKGDITPSVESYEKLCKILNVDINYLFTGTGGGQDTSSRTLTEDESMYRIKYEQSQSRIIELLDEIAFLKGERTPKKVTLNRKEG